ncbi:MAG: hypothetical protein IJX28_07045 [Clostridia bacterium]|nr:hypothetical protein [Clostridia bacterium]
MLIIAQKMAKSQKRVAFFEKKRGDLPRSFRICNRPFGFSPFLVMFVFNKNRFQFYANQSKLQNTLVILPQKRLCVNVQNIRTMVTFASVCAKKRKIRPLRPVFGTKIEVFCKT